MLSGKETFEAVLKNFSTVKRVIVDKDGFYISFASGHHFVVSYNIVVLKSILKAMAKSGKLIEFRERPVSAAEDTVYDALIIHGLTSVHFYYGHVLPDIYKD